MALSIPKEFLGVLAGAEASVTFKTSPTNTVGVTEVVILSDKPLYIAPTQAALAIQADGTEGQRVFIPGGSTFLTIPWGKNKTLYLKNIDITDSVRIQIIGLV